MEIIPYADTSALFCKLLKSSSVFAEYSGGNKVELLILGHFDLRLCIQINHKELGTVVFKDDYAPVLFGQPCDLGEILIRFGCSNNRICRVVISLLFIIPLVSLQRLFFSQHLYVAVFRVFIKLAHGDVFRGAAEQSVHFASDL